MATRPLSFQNAMGMMKILSSIRSAVCMDATYIAEYGIDMSEVRHSLSMFVCYRMQIVHCRTRRYAIIYR